MSQPTAKNNPARFILIATGLAVVVVVAVVALNRQWLTGILGPQYETPALCADYLPSDAGAVVRLNLRQTQDSKYVKQHFEPVLQSIREQLLPSMQNSLGVDPAKDLDWLQLTVTAGDHDHPLVLMSGNIDPAKFKLDPKGLHEVTKPASRHRLYELPEGELKRTFTLVLADPLLLACDKPSRVTNALEDAAAGRKPALDDATLADLLKKVDRQQSIWGVASLKQLAPIPKLNSATAESLLRPILQNADAIYGGITCGEDIQGTIYFMAGNEFKATVLEEKLRALCEEAKGLHLLMKLAQPKSEYLPLLQFAGSGQVSRMENTVMLKCRLP